MDKVNRWDQYRSTFLLLGFALSLGFVNLCFMIESEPPNYEPFEVETLEDPIIEQPRTLQEKKVKLPPPPEEPEPIIKKQILDDIKLVNEEPVVEDKDELITQDPDEPIFEALTVDTVTNEPAPIVEIEPEPEIEKIFDFVERMPLLENCFNKESNYSDQRACSDKSILAFLYKQIKYPAIARENRVEGTVVASMVIDLEGNISAVEIIRDIGAGCGQEVYKAIKNCPKWMPGKQNGRPVKVKIKIPVKFKLQG